MKKIYEKELPEGIPAPPEGWVYVGVGCSVNPIFGGGMGDCYHLREDSVEAGWIKARLCGALPHVHHSIRESSGQLIRLKKGLDTSKPVQTRGGSPAVIYTTDHNGRIAGGIYEGGSLTLVQWGADGRFFYMDECQDESEDDLINVPEEPPVRYWDCPADIPSPCWIKRCEEGAAHLVTVVAEMKVETESFEAYFPEISDFRWSDKPGTPYEEMKECVKEEHD